MRREADGAVITQFDYPTCETLGLLKMDFLGLRNLTVIDDALRNIVANGKEPIDLDEISKDLTDPATYALLARGDTLGVFQFDGGPMRSLLRLMRPDNFEDISAVGALYRPGPMGANSHTNYALRKNGQQEITPIHPELAEPLEDILGTTYGLIVYQEQVMAIAQKVAGYSLGKADLLRRAMGKKKKSVLDAEFVGFEAGMKATRLLRRGGQDAVGHPRPVRRLRLQQGPLGRLRLVSYWTAYLKANYPAEYMAGLLTSVGDDKDRRPIYLAECRRMGIKVLPPDVNESSWDFTAVGTDIRFGLASVRNVGHNVVDSIRRAREEKGAVQGLRGLHAQDRHGGLQQEGHRVPGQGRGVRLPGPLPAGHRRRPRPGRRLRDGAQAQGGRGAVRPLRQLRRRGTRTTPSAERWTSRSPTADWSKSERLVFERDMLGLYVSDHPLHGVEHVLTSHADTSLAEIIAGGIEDGANVTIAGILTAVGPRTNKQGAPWAIATVEDLEAGLEVLFFPKTWAQVSDKVVRDQIVVVKGRISRRDDTPSLFAAEVSIPELTEGPRGPVLVSMPAARCTPPVVERLREVLGSHPGTTEVQLKLVNGARETVLRLDQGLRVRPSTALMGDIKALLGPTSVALL
jgi:DNA polymerase-3 subunit alpha